jgi:hypothetical protein
MSQGSLFALARRLRGERGQTSAEYVGVVVVVCAIVAVLLNAGIGELLSGTLSRAIAGLGADGGPRGERGGPRSDGPTAPAPPAGDPPGGPAPADATIPPPPPPPAQPAEGDGAGEFDSEGASPLDYAREGLAHQLADAAEARGYTDAARHLRHYLDGSGEPLDVSPEKLIRDMPEFRAQVESGLQRHVQEVRDAALAQYTGQPLTLQTSSD